MSFSFNITPLGGGGGPVPALRRGSSRSASRKSSIDPTPLIRMDRYAIFTDVPRHAVVDDLRSILSHTGHPSLQETINSMSYSSVLAISCSVCEIPSPFLCYNPDTMFKARPRAHGTTLSVSNSEWNQSKSSSISPRLPLANLDRG